MTGIKLDLFQILRIIIVSVAVLIILVLGLVAGTNSKTRNCCATETAFINCQKYFGCKSNMNKDMYKKICLS
jgi:hypothetical protein